MTDDTPTRSTPGILECLRNHYLATIAERLRGKVVHDPVRKTVTETFLTRSHCHLYRGGDLQEKVKDILRRFDAWRMSQVPLPGEDSNLRFLAALVEEAEQEAPPS